MAATSCSDEVHLTSRARCRSEPNISRDKGAPLHLGQTDITSVIRRHIGSQAVCPNRERETGMTHYRKFGQVVDCCREAPSREIPGQPSLSQDRDSLDIHQIRRREVSSLKKSGSGCGTVRPIVS
jgi:hypothetical protein